MAHSSQLAARQENQMAQDRDDNTIYQVVVNHEEQYSVWLADHELPSGWKAAGKKGTKQECLEYIEEVWTDMRPLSLRKKMDD
jgi:MbtH protein